MRAFLPTETTHNGGSSEPDMKAFAVIPRISPRTWVVITVTPVTNDAITRRNRVSVTASSAVAGEAASVVIGK
jgi:hypothetical protein